MCLEDNRSARKHFAFLDVHKFTLRRESGALGMDSTGLQRMEMLGVRSQGRNARKRPNRIRKHIDVYNPRGDLDAYVIQFDQPHRFGGHLTRHIWDALSRRMHALLPRATRELVEELERAAVRQRLFSAAACVVVSHDLAVNNVGVSSAYQSPVHKDRSDVGWTYAFACKCEH